MTVQHDATRSPGERGSALLMSVFVLLLVSVMGIALLFLSSNEAKMSRVSVNIKQAFYLAEAGVEDGRTTLYMRNGAGSFTDDLERAAGLDKKISLDLDNLRGIFDDQGNLTGLIGTGDDEPLKPITRFGGGSYVVFLSNDPAEDPTTTFDGNQQVMLTGIGAGPGRSLEIVQAIVDLEKIFPSYPTATITLLGPDPDFYGATSDPKTYNGEDCGGAGVPGLAVPVVGTIGSEAETKAEEGINPNPTYVSGSYGDEETFADLTDETESTVVTSNYGAIDSSWTDCASLKEMVEMVRLVADVVCHDESCVVPPPSPRRIIFVDGDYEVGANDRGQGLLLVTGTLRFHGNADWSGLVYTIGEGRFVRYGSGGGTISGATVVADIAGPDNVYGTADDCSGGDGGFESVLYDERGGGNSDTTYCTKNFIWTDPARPYEVLMFRQL